MKATRRDFDAMADLIHRERGLWMDDVEGFKLFVIRFADILSRSNPAFDRQKWNEACLYGTRKPKGEIE